MEMTRARGSEEMGEEEVEKTSETSDSGGVSFEDLVCDWRGPDDLSGDLEDLVWDTERLAEGLAVSRRQFFPLLYQLL